MDASRTFSRVDVKESSSESGWQPVRNRRTSPRKERSERYARNGPLSPLRSPLRTEVDRNTGKSSRRFSEGRRRYNKDSKRDDYIRDANLEPINSITKQIEELEACSAPAWAVVNKEPAKTSHVDEEEFPSLDTKYTPETRKSLDDSNCSALSWASQVEEQESSGKSSKRKLVMNDTRQSNARDKRNNRRQGKFSRREETTEELEKDKQVIERRQKQLEYGKKTEEYKRYSGDVGRDMRTKNHPWTPDKAKKFSRRSWDMQVKIWRRQLHIWDPPTQGGNDDASSVASSDLEVSNTAMEVESNGEPCDVRVSTPQNSQDSDAVEENDLLEPVSPVNGAKHPVINVPLEDEEFLDL